MDALKIYLKCWINLILHYRNIYPATSFALETFNVFNLPINFPINRNPILIDYIENLIQDFLEVLKHSQKVLDESSLDILNELAPKEPLESLHGCVFTLAIFETDDTPEMAIVSAQVPVEKFVIDFDEFDLSKFAELESLESSEIYDEFRESLFGLYQFCCKLPKLEDARYVFKVFMEHAAAMDESVENSENWLKINPKKNTKLRGENTLEKTTRQFQGQKSGLLGVDLGEELILYEYYQCSKKQDNLWV
ncbi:hypothetical protein ACO0QE_001134 [Hanseniaspora vineae]